MRSGEIVKSILDSQGKSQRSFAGEIGLTPQALGSRLSGNSDMRVDSLVQMADALGYKVVVTPDGDSGVEYNVTAR